MLKTLSAKPAIMKKDPKKSFWKTVCFHLVYFLRSFKFRKTPSWKGFGGWWVKGGVRQKIPRNNMETLKFLSSMIKNKIKLSLIIVSEKNYCVFNETRLPLLVCICVIVNQQSPCSKTHKSLITITLNYFNV